MNLERAQAVNAELDILPYNTERVYICVNNDQLDRAKRMLNARHYKIINLKCKDEHIIIKADRIKFISDRRMKGFSI